MDQRNSQPLVTVVVPVYNVEEYLVCCLDSIIEQTYQNLEIILVNDGSTDGSGEICLRYEQSDPRVRVFTQENRGLSAARNTGLDHMKGDYVVFVDSDDYISPCMVEVLLNELLRCGAPFVVCNHLLVEDEDDHAPLDMVAADEPYPSRKMTRNEVFETMWTKSAGKFQLAWGKIYEKRIFETLRYEVGKIYEDAFIYHELYSKVEWICYVDLKLCAYRMRLNSITRKDGVDFREIDVLMEMWLRRLGFFQQYGVDEYIRHTENLMFSELVLYMADGNTPKEQIKQYVQEAERSVYQITGKRFFSWRWVLFKTAPGIYRIMRNCLRKLASWGWALLRCSPAVYRFIRSYYRKARNFIQALKHK